MIASNERLTILSEVEQAALYEIPDFDNAQRLNYLNLTSEEQALMRSRANLSAQVHCAIQIGYFKAKHLFFSFDWDEAEVQDDIRFVMLEYFPEQFFHPALITKHQYYAQCHAIASHFGYQMWSKEFEPLLIDRAEQILRRDISPQFIVIELLAFMREKKIMRPGYTTLQVIVRNALNVERNRIRVILQESLTEENKANLKKLLFEKEDETLSGLADLKHDTKDFKSRMMSAERDKLLSIKPLYLLAQSLLPKLNLSHQNIQYYASLVDYYTTYDLRKELKSEQTYLYLLCYIQQRYLHLNDNLIDAFFIHLKQFEGEIKEKAQEAYSEYAISKQSELSVMKKLARLFVTPELSNEVNFGEVRKAAFTIIPEDELRNTVSVDGDKELKAIDFQWKMIDKHFHRYKLQLRPLMMAIDFSSTAPDSPWLAAITWLKEIFDADKTINKYPVTDSPEKTRPKRLQPYLFGANAKGEQKFHGDRYEFWIYRQMKKRVKAGELYLSDSVHHRSLQQEISSANEKEALVQPLDIPALRNPIKKLLDERIAELDAEWMRFNNDFTQGKLKHLFYDEKTQTLHLKKSKTENDEEAQYRFYEQLPLCDITDVIRFVNERCRYSSAFTHIQPRYAKQLADENSLNAVIIAQAFNNGNLNMAEISDIPYDTLLNIYQTRMRLQTLKKANDLIGDDIAKMPIFPYYSLDMAILYGGVDGQKFEVARPTLKARRSKKYFKKGKGVVAYTMLVNHIPLQTELIGAHEHESYFAFDIWYNNTSSIMPDAITGDMHVINKANFALMDWFGGRLCPRFTNLQTQRKHLYCGGDLAQYNEWQIKPVGTIDRQLIEDEWPNIEPIIRALGLKEISQSILIKKLCTYTTSNRTRKAIFEYDKLIRSIYTLKYLQDRKLQRDVHRSQNRVESYHQLRSAIATAYGKKQLSGRGDREIEITNQCARLIANAIIHYNSAILSKLKLKYEAEGNQKALARLKKISPVAWQHIHFQGHFIFSGDKIIDLDTIINKVSLGDSRKLSVTRNCPEISTVPG